MKKCCELLTNDPAMWDKFPFSKMCVNCLDVIEREEEDEVYWEMEDE